MHLNRFTTLFAMGAIIASCATGPKESSADAPVLIGPYTGEVKEGLLTPELLNSFGKISGVQVSPDGNTLLYGVGYTSIEQNKGNRELFTQSIDGSDKRQITNTGFSEQNEQFMDGGKKIAFLSNESGSVQLWTMNVDGTNRTRVSDIEGGIEGFLLSPDESKVLYIASIKLGNTTAERYPDLSKASGRIVTDLMYKHWDEWKESVPHPFVADFDGKALSNPVDLLQGEPYESPVKPFGGIEQLAWSPDSKQIAYTSRKKTGMEYAVSTNTDIYLYDIESRATTNLTDGMMGYDINPAFSPDGTKLAFQSMERDGYESDKNRLFVLDLATKEKHYVTAQYDANADNFSWGRDNETLYMVSCVKATTHLYKVTWPTKEITRITEGVCDFTSVAVANNCLIALNRSMSQPVEIYRVDETTGEYSNLSQENKALLEKVRMGKVEERWIATTDGKKMLTWVIYPPDFDPAKKYPALLYCQGGPQSTVSQFWSTRWNPQLMAANGYIVVAPNRRGLPSFGQEWLEQISGDYGGQNMKDYFSAIDALKAEPFVDENRLGAVGASYGGFSVYWLAGNHNKRFKAFISHAGIFNLEMQYLETEEMWFANWDLGGPFWDKSNATAQRTYASSPHRFVDKWDTPILITHGELDYRILASQGMAAFNAAKLRGIPTEMLIYPDENHWIARPQNSILFHRVFLGWLDKHLK